MVALETLVAELAAETEGSTIHRRASSSRAEREDLGSLSIARLGPKMLDVAVGNVGDLRFAEGTFVMLGLSQARLDGLRAVDTLEIEGPSL